MEREASSSATGINNNTLHPEIARKRANESGTGMLVFMMMGRFLVELAANNEPNPQVRRYKRRQLLQEWSQYTSHVART